MRPRHGLAACAAAALCALLSPSAGARVFVTGPDVNATCNGGACSTNWYTSNVTVAFYGRIRAGSCRRTAVTRGQSRPIRRGRRSPAPSRIRRTCQPPSVSRSNATQRLPPSTVRPQHMVRTTAAGTTGVSRSSFPERMRPPALRSARPPRTAVRTPPLQPSLALARTMRATPVPLPYRRRSNTTQRHRRSPSSQRVARRTATVRTTTPFRSRSAGAMRSPVSRRAQRSPQRA
jgi:hypothetical protein